MAFIKKLAGLINMKKIIGGIGVKLGFFLFASCLSAQDLPVTSREIMAINFSEIQRVRDSVRSFLTSWLLDRDVSEAKKSFGSAAFKNAALLQDPCAQYIKYDDLKSEKAISSGIEEFLRDFLPNPSVTSLHQVLNKQTIASLADQFESRSVNNAMSDLFILVKLSKNELTGEESWETDYLKESVSSDFYASFVPVDEGLIFFIWIPDGNRWVIYHASIFCV